MRETVMSVRTEAGDLRAIVWHPDVEGPRDPAPVLPKVQCPVFGAFGGADPDVPAQRSVAVFASLLPANPRHALAVFPGADHGLFVAGPDHSVPLANRLAPGFLPMLRAWLNAT